MPVLFAYQWTGILLIFKFLKHRGLQLFPKVREKFIINIQNVMQYL